MSFIPDMAPLDGWQHIEARAVAIGWLGDFVPQSGQVSEVEMRVLRHFRNHYTFCDGLMGLHTCEICHQAELHNEFWVGYGGVRYVLPVGIFHYIEAHDYCPPKEFLAVLNALAENPVSCGSRRHESNVGGRFFWQQSTLETTCFQNEFLR